MTSPVLKVGPNGLPIFCPVKHRPSSPWYAQDSGSQPTGLDMDAAFVAKPTAIVVLEKLSAHPSYSYRCLDNLLVSFSVNDVNFVIVDSTLGWHGVVRSYGRRLVVTILMAPWSNKL